MHEFLNSLQKLEFQKVKQYIKRYTLSTLGGELYAQAYLDNPLILRTSGVYGPGGLKTARGNFVELMPRLEEHKKRK